MKAVYEKKRLLGMMPLSGAHMGMNACLEQTTLVLCNQYCNGQKKVNLNVSLSRKVKCSNYKKKLNNEMKPYQTSEFMDKPLQKAEETTVMMIDKAQKTKLQRDTS